MRLTNRAQRLVEGSLVVVVAYAFHAAARGSFVEIVLDAGSSIAVGVWSIRLSIESDRRSIDLDRRARRRA